MMDSCRLSLTNIGNIPFSFSSGDLARQANGSVSISYGDTVVLVTACASKGQVQSRGFLPLFVDYQERTYAMGKIPGGYIKKEGRPKDKEILCSRLIDRPLRPLFPKGYIQETQIIAMVLSSDGENDPDVLAVNGASCALFISDIPFNTPVGAVRVGMLEGGFIVNPTYEERSQSPMDIIVVGTEEKIVMLEGEFNELSEEDIFKAIEYARPFIREIIKGQRELREKIGKKKEEFSPPEFPQDLFSLVEKEVSSRLEELYGLPEKEDKETAWGEVLEDLYKKIVEEKEIEVTLEDIKKIFYELESKIVRRKILEQGKRPDNREIDQIREINCDVGILPRTHGSALFTRGQTQALAAITLGTSSDEQFVDALEGKKSKRFMLHYSFPPFSVGEIKPLRGPSRRDIGHGALAEKALLSVMPSEEEFPYTIRVVSEILESNGSSSMATTCAASLSLMDAGIPIKKPVAGIALGLIKEAGNYKILTDIAGVEDHYGDMDFKVAGTEAGVCAIQVDIKIDGLELPLVQEALERAKKARFFILEKMNQTLALPRGEVSKYAPKIKLFKIDTERIGEVIGPGGKMIRRLIRENNVAIDINDDGMVCVVAETEESLNQAANQILNLLRDIQPGDIFEGKVTKIMNFGAFCEIIPGKNGLVHVSELSDKFVKDVREVVTEGDIVKVKVVNIDSQGRINLSMKQCHEETSPSN